MRYTVTSSIVRVVGRIWMPSVVCAMDYTLSGYDIENARDEDGNITRDSVQGWLDKNAGDFAEIIDFEGDIEDGEVHVDIPWETEDGQFAYLDCHSDELV
jgi:hypothetical protein